MNGVRAKRIVTCDPARTGALGVVEDGAVVHDRGQIVFVGAASEAPVGVDLVDAGDVVVTPGLVDAHTHACWAGSRTRRVRRSHGGG